MKVEQKGSLTILGDFDKAIQRSNMRSAHTRRCNRCGKELIKDLNPNGGYFYHCPDFKSKCKPEFADLGYESPALKNYIRPAQRIDRNKVKIKRVVFDE